MMSTTGQQSAHPIFAPTLFIQKNQVGIIWETVALKIAGLKEWQPPELTFL
jgi:hypothetical protein